jgi:hypothetical protein
MRRHPLRDFWFLLLAFGTAFTLGCSRPLTDIVANSSEDVGAWDIANAHVNGRTLAADVCLQKMDESDKVSERLLLQLRNKGYDRIELAMYSAGDGQTQRRPVTWTSSSGTEMQQPSQSSQNPCATAAHDGGHEAGAEAGTAGH